MLFSLALSHTHTYTHTHTHTRMHTHTHTRVHTHTCVHTRTCTHTHTHVRAHTHTHANTHTHTELTQLGRGVSVSGQADETHSILGLLDSPPPPQTVLLSHPCQQEIPLGGKLQAVHKPWLKGKTQKVVIRTINNNKINKLTSKNVLCMECIVQLITCRCTCTDMFVDQ